MSGNDDSMIENGNIYSFDNKATEDIFREKDTSAVDNCSVPAYLHDTIREILNNLNEASTLLDLKRHEIRSVQGTPDDEKWFELRINEQYRIYFQWDSEKGARHIRASEHL